MKRRQFFNKFLFFASREWIKISKSNLCSRSKVYFFFAFQGRLMASPKGPAMMKIPLNIFKGPGIELTLPNAYCRYFNFITTFLSVEWNMKNLLVNLFFEFILLWENILALSSKKLYFFFFFFLFHSDYDVNNTTRTKKL